MENDTDVPVVGIEGTQKNRHRNHEHPKSAWYGKEEGVKGWKTNETMHTVDGTIP